MQRAIRIAWLAYVVFLTLLLLTSNPARLIGVSGAMPGFLWTLMPWAHLLSFGVLAVLTLLARWPVPRWSVVLVLAALRGSDGNHPGLRACENAGVDRLVPRRRRSRRGGGDRFDRRTIAGSHFPPRRANDRQRATASQKQRRACPIVRHCLEASSGTRRRKMDDAQSIARAVLPSYRRRLAGVLARREVPRSSVHSTANKFAG